MALRQRWPQQAAHEDHIGTVPVRRRKRTEIVLLIKTDIARPLSGDDVDTRTSRARGLRGKRIDQSGANTAITVAFVEIDVQMARIAIAQWRNWPLFWSIGALPCLCAGEDLLRYQSLYL